MALAPIFSWTDKSFLSAWSIMHFLSGYLWNVVWTWAFDGALPVLNLALLVVVACVFELVENQKGSGDWLWGSLGYDTTTYTGDSAINAVSDVLLSVVGWCVVAGAAAIARTTLVLGLLLGTAAVIFVAFLFLFRIERQKVFVASAAGSV